MKKKYQLIKALLISSFVTACSTATTESIWHSKNIGTISGILVFSTARNVSNRGEIEREIATALSQNGLYAQSSLELIGPNIDPKNLTQKISASEKLNVFSNMLIVSIIDVKKHQDYIPGSFDGDYDYYDYYGDGGYYNYNSGYYEEISTYQILSKLYKSSNNQLVWSEITDITNPSSLISGSADLSKNIAKNLAKDVSSQSELQ